MKLFALSTALLLLLTFDEALARPKTVIEDAIEQSSKLLRCWDPIKDENGEVISYALSEPIYELCNYMPLTNDYSKSVVGGVDENSDNYNVIKELWENNSVNHQTLTVCLQEAFQLEGNAHPSAVTIRCLCKRNGCNMMKPFSHFLDRNSRPLTKYEF